MNAPDTEPGSWEFTGRHMLIVVVSFFAVVIGVNMVLVYYANSSWSGLVVPNTYVASQHFDDDVAAQKAMQAKGWVSTLDAGSGRIAYKLADASGSPVGADEVVLSFQRPVSESEDRVVHLQMGQTGYFEAPSDLGTGQWVVRVEVMSDGEVLYHESRRLIVSATGG